MTDWIVAMAIGAVAGGGIVTMVALSSQHKEPKACPGEVVSMVIDKDGTILCTYMLVPQGVTKEVKKVK